MKKDIVYKKDNGQILTNSLLVAEKFSKQHKHVIDTIRKLISSAENSAQFFASTTYIDESGKKNLMYVMNRDGFTLLAMGFTGEKALQFKLDYIEAFNKMEQTIKKGCSLPNFEDPVEAALAWAEQYKEKQLALQKIEEDKPKVEFYNEMIENRDYFTISSIAIELKVTAASLNKFLLDTGWFTKKFSIIIADDEHKSWQCDVPYYQTKKDGTKYIMTSLVRWSKEGRENIIKLWKSNKQKQENNGKLY